MRKEYDFSKLKARKNPYAGRTKKAVGINLSPARAAIFRCRSSKEANPVQPASSAAATCNISAERARVAAACLAESVSARR